MNNIEEDRIYLEVKVISDNSLYNINVFIPLPVSGQDKEEEEEEEEGLG